MPTSQKPRIPAPFLATAAALSFRPTKRDKSGSTLGVLVDASGTPQHVGITSDGPDATWAISATARNSPRSFLLYESAANVVRGGNPSPDGSISYQGGSYLLESAFDGDAWAVKLSSSA